MIYLTTDSMDQAVYFDLRKTEQRRRHGDTGRTLYGLVGNGITEVPVTVENWRDWTGIVFGSGELFSFVDEHNIRRMLGEVARELALH